MDEDLLDQFAPYPPLGQIMKLPPQAAVAKQEKLFPGNVGPRHAEDPFFAAARAAWVNQPITGSGKGGFNQAQGRLEIVKFSLHADNRRV